MSTTFAEVLADDRVEFDELQSRYSPVLNMVDVLIGVVPYSDRYLEIWQPGFRSYNLLVPNFLNLPSSLFGRNSPKSLVGLGMYASSRAARCNYCSAHSCSFALRRGSSADSVTGKARTPAERAVVAVAEALSTDPHHYKPELGAELRRNLSTADAEWVVMGIAMMGFLNKFMDAIGVELEPDVVNDVEKLITPTGWSVGQHGWADEGGSNTQDSDDPSSPPLDSIKTLLRVMRNAPGAIRLEKKWMADTPKDSNRAIRELDERFGFDSGLLHHMAQAKPRRALAAVLRQNLDPSESEIGIPLKSLVGLIYSSHAGNPYLIERAEKLAWANGLSSEYTKAAREFVPGSAVSAHLDDRTLAAFTVAGVMSPSPARVDSDAIKMAEAHLSSEEIVEIAVWISANQLLHRLSVYYNDQALFW